MPLKRGFLFAAGIDRMLEALEQFRFEPDALEYLDRLNSSHRSFSPFSATCVSPATSTPCPKYDIFRAGTDSRSARTVDRSANYRDPRAQPDWCGVDDCQQGCTMRRRGSRPAPHRLRLAPQSGRRRRSDRRAFELPGRLRRHLQVLAGRRYGIPLNGTMAHSYIMAHDSEREAFEHFVALFPQLSTLLVDTYDTVRGVENAARVARDLKAKGLKLQAVRLDSGDLVDLSVRARRILDQNDLGDVAIFASGNLDDIASTICSAPARRSTPLASAPRRSLAATRRPRCVLQARRVPWRRPAQDFAGQSHATRPQAGLSRPQRERRFHRRPDGLADEGVTTVANEFKPTPAEVSALLTRQMVAGARVEPASDAAESRDRLLQAFARLGQRYKISNVPTFIRCATPPPSMRCSPAKRSAPKNASRNTPALNTMLMAKNPLRKARVPRQTVCLKSATPKPFFSLDRLARQMLSARPASGFAVRQGAASIRV